MKIIIIIIIMVNHTKPTNTLSWNWYLLKAGNYKPASGKLHHSITKIAPLKNNTIQCAMWVSINCVIRTRVITCLKGKFGKN